MDFENVLRKLMKERALRVKDIADQTKISPSTLKTWLAGAAPRDLDAVRTLARFFQISMEKLLFGEDEHLNNKDVFNNFQLETILNDVVRIKIERIIPQKDSKNDDGK